MQSAVFFDIDGTLWNYDHYIPASTREAIKLLRQNGHLAFLCSGRARAFIQNRDLLSLGWDGIVCACGSHVEIDGSILYEKILPPAEVKELIDFIRPYGLKPILEGPVNLYMDDDEYPQGDDFGDILRADLGEDLLTISGEYEGKWHINKLSCDTADAGERIEECLSIIRKKYDIIVHDGPFCEIIAKGISKGTGLLKACELMGVDVANTYAFGDSENDLEMLKNVAHGVAMGNGTDNAKAVAQYITDAFDEDGIFNGLRHYKLI